MQGISPGCEKQEEFLEIRHNGKPVKLKLEEVIEHAQKGFDYTAKTQELAEQRPGEFDDAVQFVSHIFASQSGRHCSEERKAALFFLREAIVQAWSVLHPSDSIQEAWKSAARETQEWCILAACGGLWISEWPGVERITNSARNWKHRIFSLGNGQVPRVAAAAWRILSERAAESQGCQTA